MILNEVGSISQKNCITACMGKKTAQKMVVCFGKTWLQSLQKLADWGVTSSRRIFAKLSKFKNLGRVFKQVIVLWKNWPFLKPHWNQNKLITNHHLLLMYNRQRLERGWTENITTNWTHYFLWLIIKIKKKFNVLITRLLHVNFKRKIE